jgi:hypothetical protein
MASAMKLNAAQAPEQLVLLELLRRHSERFHFKKDFKGSDH